MIDLQCHTLASDGELTPEELVDLAIEKKLEAIAITDHDTVDSVKKAIDYSKGKKIEIIPAIELSCDDPFSEYEKIDGQWFMSNVKLHHFYRSPYEGGWAKERNMSLKVDD